jgi:DNA-binding NarL/FixJ family response regulator
MIHLAIKMDPAVVWPSTLTIPTGYRLHHLTERQTPDSTLSLCWICLDGKRSGLDRCVADIMSATETRFWVLDAMLDSKVAEALVKAGARGYSAMPVSSADLARGLECILAGEYWVPRTVLQSLVRDLIEDDPHTMLPIGLDLTPREREVAGHVASGYSNKRVARAMGVTERTVKAHLSSIFQKTPAVDRLELALLMKGELPERIRIDLK